MIGKDDIEAMFAVKDRVIRGVSPHREESSGA
jgi:hypothetical protein